MEYIQWQPAFNLDGGKIDEQHRYLVQILNETYEMMMKFVKNEHFIIKLEELREYAEKHFQFEEALMESRGYPDFRNHCGIHREFIGEIDELERKIRKGKKSAPAEIFVFLRDWLLEHIQVTDRKYAPYLCT